MLENLSQRERFQYIKTIFKRRDAEIFQENFTGISRINSD
jgi:hypothetical protein